jgi:uncharacterized NAD-dependent epimerase/dehydratase family protein
MRGVQAPVPSIAEVITATELLGRVTNPAIRCVGIAVNTERLDEAAAVSYLRRAAAAHALPAVDPVRFGCGPLVEHLLADFGLSARAA